MTREVWPGLEEETKEEEVDVPLVVVESSLSYPEPDGGGDLPCTFMCFLREDGCV